MGGAAGDAAIPMLLLLLLMLLLLLDFQASAAAGIMPDAQGADGAAASCSTSQRPAESMVCQAGDQCIDSMATKSATEGHQQGSAMTSV